MHQALRDAIDNEKRLRDGVGSLTPQSSSGSSSQATYNSMIGSGVPMGGSVPVPITTSQKAPIRNNRSSMLINNYKMADEDGSTMEDKGKLLRTVSFKHALQKTINQDLTALLQDLLDVTIDDMEYKDNDFKCQNRNH